jgi:probable rRNA maturation factor
VSASRPASADGPRPAPINVDVSATVRNPGISRGRTRDLVRATLERERVKDALVSVAFVGVHTMSQLNREFLSHNGPTDVIAFALGRGMSGSRRKQARTAGRGRRSLPVIGDIYICQAVAERNARKLGIPLRQELARLVVHGTLHVLGYEHPRGDARISSPMWRRQEKILDFVK